MSSRNTRERELTSDESSEQHPMMQFQPNPDHPVPSNSHDSRGYSSTAKARPNDSFSPREEESSLSFQIPTSYDESRGEKLEPASVKYDNLNAPKKFFKGALYTGINSGETGENFNEVNNDQVLNNDVFFPPKEKMSTKDDVFEEKGLPSPTGPVGWIGFGLSVFALACLCVSFASPYWIQAYPNSNNEFRNMGLWEVCFDKYMHYKDDSQEVYDGCWWVFNQEERYSKLREWLLPPWFITVQVLVTLTLLAQLATIFIVMLVYLHMCPMMDHNLHQTYAMFAASGLSFFITILTLIVGIMYGIMCGKREWMPRPDLNLISWGYGFWIIQGIFTTAAGVCYFLESQRAFAKIEEQEAIYEDEMTALHEMSRSQLGGFPSQPSFAEPPYGQSSYVGQISYDQNLPEFEPYANQPTYSNNPAYPGQPPFDQYDPNYQNYGTEYQNYGGGEGGASYGEYPEKTQPPMYTAYP